MTIGNGTNSNTQSVDVLIIGAGLSGVSAACHLRRMCPGQSFIMVERRQRPGGTWNLFQYPGVRSDSDMFSMGYRFRPWLGTKVLASGKEIQRYIEETIRYYSLEETIHFGVRGHTLSWCGEQLLWQLDARCESTGELRVYQARFVIGCTGYYDYDQGHQPEIKGSSAFSGQLIHPQHWPTDYKYANQNMVVVGSGATAMTLVPALARKAKHVTMLQRSPTYVASVDSIDRVSELLGAVLPRQWVYHLGRIKNIVLQRLVFWVCRKYPNAMKRLFIRAIGKRMGPDFDLSHFTPRYDPWDQRFCVVPDGDLFDAIESGKAEIQTDEIECMVADGLVLKSGKHLKADAIVLATGLKLQMLGGMVLKVDGKKVRTGQLMSYKGVMFDGVPNMGVVFGYSNSSWTLKADLSSHYYCRLIRYMARKGWQTCVATADPTLKTNQDFLGLESGYVRRAENGLPRQGLSGPWRTSNNFFVDYFRLRYGRLNDGVLKFTRN